MIYCGEAEGGSASASGGSSEFVQQLLAPLAYGAADVDLVTGTETFPNVTQSETYTSANPDNPDQIVVAYNDSRGRSSNPSTIPARRSPTTAARPSPASSKPPSVRGHFPNTFGDPGYLYHKPDGTWYTVLARRRLRRTGPWWLEVHQSFGSQ